MNENTEVIFPFFSLHCESQEIKIYNWKFQETSCTDSQAKEPVQVLKDIRHYCPSRYSCSLHDKTNSQWHLPEHQAPLQNSTTLSL